MIYLILILLLFESALNKQLNFTIIDEIISLSLFAYYLYGKYVKHVHAIDKVEKKTLTCIYLFFLAGALSALIYNYQKSIFYGLESGLFSCKAFLSYFGARTLLDKYKLKPRQLLGFLHFIEWSLVIAALLLIINRIYPIFPIAGYKFGMSTTSFIFAHGTDLMCFSILMLMIAIYIRNLLNLKRKIYFNYIPALIIAFNCINYKGLAFYSLLILIMLFLPFVKRFKLRYLIIFVPFVLFLVMDQIEFYSNITSSRGALIYYAFIIASKHFPLGAGFGTYGTEFSRKIYSPLYSQYGLNTIWGLSQDNSSFICDTMWAGIIGETGYIGLFSILMFFLYLFKRISKQKDLKRECMALQYLLIVYGIIECFGDSIFMSARGVTIFVILAFFISLSNKFGSKEC